MSKQLKVFLGFCFCLQSACKTQILPFSLQILPSSFQRSPARCRRTLCRSNLWPTFSIHEKFWPTSESCLCSQIQFWFPLHVHLANNWLWLPIRVQFWCSLESNLSGQLDLSSRGEVYARHVTGSANCKNSSVYFVMKKIVRLQLFSGILHQYKSWTIYGCVNVSTRSLCFCNGFSCARIAVFLT